MEVVFLFLLLNLPRDALQNVFRIMCIAQVFGISLLSARAKNLITSLELNFGCWNLITIGVTKAFSIHFQFLPYQTLSIFLYSVEEQDPVQELDVLESFIIRPFAQEDLRWTNSGNLSVKQLIECLKTIFHRSRVELTVDLNAHRYDLESIHKAVENISLISIRSQNHEHNRRVVNLIKPPTLVLSTWALQNEKVPMNMIMQNFNKLNVLAPIIRLTLDEMLLINSKEVNMFTVNLSGKDLNRFLKLWKAGSNPNLEIIRISFLDGVVDSEEMVYAGLGCQDVTEVRFFKSRDERVDTGKDIVRRDGVKATIRLDDLDGLDEQPSFEMVVWHHHCIVQETNP